MITVKTAGATATLWAMLQHGILGVAALLAALMVIVTFLGKVIPRGRALVRQVGDVHSVILGDEETPSLVDRLNHGDKRMGAIERDLSTVVGQQQELNRKVGQVERSLGVLGDHERLDIRQAIAAASEPRPRRRTDPDPPPPTPIRRTDGDV